MTSEKEYPGDDPFLDYKNKPHTVCKYLGVSDDPDTYFQYVSTWNYCHRPNSIQSLLPTHQADFCLSEKHKRCPVFQDSWSGEFPKDLMALTSPGRGSRAARYGGRGPGRGGRAALGWFLVLAAVAGILGLFAWTTPAVRVGLVRLFGGPQAGRPSQVAGGGSLPVASETPALSQSLAPSATVEPSMTPLPSRTALPTLTPLPTETPAPTETPFPTPGPGLETPFGPSGQFVIHVVAPGESFNAIAARYNTTPEVLQAVNPSIEGTSLWVGRQLVVPIGASSAEDLPAFSVLFTTETVMLSDLAEEFGSDVEDIRYYNQLGDTDSVLSGRWLIIPIAP